MITRRLSGSHDMTFGNGIADMAIEAESCAQNVQTRLLLLAEEWFLDTSSGVPYLQEIMLKPSNIHLAESIIKRTILETFAVSEIRSFKMDFDHNTRKLFIEVTIANIYGTTANIKVVR